MKLTKLALLAAAATFALGVSNASAAPSVTLYNSKLTVSATITTNTAEVVSGNNWKDPIKTAKFGNKQLLDLFASWADTTWPKGAQLVIGWDWDYDVLVVDKTGTNVLFDATTGVAESAAYFLVDFFDEYGVGNDSGNNGTNGFYAVTDTGSSDFTLYDDNYVLPYTYMWGNGGNKQVFKQSWKGETYTTWSDSESSKFLYNGDQYFLDGSSDSTSTATITAKGSGKGENYIGWAD